MYVGISNCIFYFQFENLTIHESKMRQYVSQSIFFSLIEQLLNQGEVSINLQLDLIIELLTLADKVHTLDNSSQKLRHKHFILILYLLI